MVPLWKAKNWNTIIILKLKVMKTLQIKIHESLDLLKSKNSVQDFSYFPFLTVGPMAYGSQNVYCRIAYKLNSDCCQPSTLVSRILSHFFLLLTVLEMWFPSSQILDQAGWILGLRDIKSTGLTLRAMETKKASQLNKTPVTGKSLHSAQFEIKVHYEQRERVALLRQISFLVFLSLIFFKEFKLKMQCY